MQHAHSELNDDIVGELGAAPQTRNGQFPAFSNFALHAGRRWAKESLEGGPVTLSK